MSGSFWHRDTHGSVQTPRRPHDQACTWPMSSGCSLPPAKDLHTTPVGRGGSPSSPSKVVRCRTPQRLQPPMAYTWYLDLGGRGPTLSPLSMLWSCQPGGGTVPSMSRPETPGCTYSIHPFPGSHLGSCQGKGRSRTHVTLGGGQQVARQGWGRGSWRGHVYDDCLGCRRAVEKQDHTGELSSLVSSGFT